MLGWRLSDDFLKKSQAALTAKFQKQFEDRQELRKEHHALEEATRRLFRNLAKDDQEIENLVKDRRERSAQLAKTTLPDPQKRRVEPRTHFGSVDVTFVPLFNYDWTWHANTGVGSTADATASVSGDMGFLAASPTTGPDGGTASCVVAVGTYFRPIADTGTWTSLPIRVSVTVTDVTTSCLLCIPTRSLASISANTPWEATSCRTSLISKSPSGI